MHAAALVALCSLGAPAAAPEGANPAAAAPAPAEADVRVRVLVVSPEAGGQGAADALYGGFAALGVVGVEREDRVGVDLAPSRAEPFVDEAQSPDQARDALLAARAAFGNFELAAAKQKLAAAEQALLALRAPETHRDLFADVLLLRAEIELASSEQEAAALDLRRVARLLPDREALHPGLYAPALVEAYAEARARNASAAPSTAVIWPRAPGVGEVRVLVNGVAQPPGRSFTLPAGPHLLTVRAPGRVTRSIFVQLDPGAPLVWEPLVFVPEVVKARTAAVERLRKATAASAEEKAAAEELLALCGATWLVLPASPARPAVRVFTVKTGIVDAGPPQGSTVAQATAVQSAVNAALAPKVATITSDGVTTGGTTTGGQGGATTEAETSLTWPILGGGAAAAGALALAGVVAGGAGFAYYVWFNREVTPLDDPPNSVEITCCVGAQ